MFGTMVLAAAIANPTIEAARADSPPKGFHEAVASAMAEPSLMVQHPTWTRTPTSADLYAIYPSNAKSTGVSGSARIVCRVDERGRLGPCEPVSEEPTGLGFGDAATKLASYFTMRPIEWGTGLPVAGRLIVIPFRFEPPPR